MRSERVRVRSAVDHRVLRHVTEKEARLMCAEDSFGNSIEGIEPIAFRHSRKKQRLNDIVLLRPQKNERNSPCTLTMSVMVNNAFAKSGLGLSADDSIRVLDRAVDTVDAWPDEHDKRNVVISAGQVHGAIVVSKIPDRILSFA